MVAKALPEDERLRLAILHCLHILDSEERFHRITRLIAAQFGVMIAAINLLDDEHQWAQAYTHQTTSTPPDLRTFCDYTIMADREVAISDTREDEHLYTHRLTVDTADLRFYTGIPLRNAAGHPLGTLSIADAQPRTLTPTEFAQLRDFAAWATQELLVTDVGAMFLQQQGVEDELRISEMRSRTMIEAINEGVVLQDRDGTIHTWNASAERILELSADELHASARLLPRLPAVYENGQIVSDSNHPGQLALQTGEPQTHVLMRVSKPDGDSSWLAVNAQPVIYPHEAKPTGVVLSFLDVTEQKRLEQRLHLYQSQLEAHNAQLAVLAATDGLTGLINRRVLAEQLDACVQQAWPSTPLALILLDVDQFKPYNDTFGHLAGDVILQKIARLLSDHSRNGDMVARYGGEEFVMLLPNTDLDTAMLVAERLRTVVATSHWPQRPITASFGVAGLNATITTGAALLRVADIALYKAKHFGRNRVVGAHQLRQHEIS